MYKVLVVDDEPFMLEGWEAMVDWEAYGYELCGTSTNGEDALDLIRACDPDLVVTDIRMPVVDGLQLIRTMKEELGHTAITVIVSGYSEFGYAQQALRYQVEHYLLKPLVTDEIHNLLRELAGPLEERRIAEASAIKDQAAAIAAAIVDLIHAREPHAVNAAARLLGANERTRCRLMMVESIGNLDGNGEAETGGIPLQDQLRTFAEYCFDGSGQAWLFAETPGRTGLLVCDDDLDDKRLEARLRETGIRLGWPTPKLALYCSGSTYGPAGVRDLYRQTMELRSRASITNQAGIYAYRERETAREWRLDDLLTYVGALLQAIESNDRACIVRTVNELVLCFDRIGAEEHWLNTTIQHIRGELLRRYAESEDSSGDAAEWLRQLLRSDSANHVCTGDSLKRVCVQAADRLLVKEVPTQTSGTPISKAVDYLKLHFREKIRLQELADRFHLSAAYFGQQFKRETGYSFHDYILHLRIEEARKLLRRTDMLVSDIAAALGYQDSDYFSDKFKAVTGELPSSYKNKRQGGA
ncbi:two-component system response regulator YesN [Paenibacillus cellulosilyticus]|uniref:Two-component system response regulator YesN n=1 Tax=Paenibacillus cellulosilyticus TaxID=375489 RepID=A0A2V2YXW3_9BACL|nr:helix-turn-helix domain-containing protein [Paenibacillus cellulosilyticus]PWW07184.1 two-component system response regulator YesN [Paenibacillus cellulosilyticus]QKS44613.1 helix-turn-helix domain-containing protein [Paenibacillus cellulosilyticus]